MNTFSDYIVFIGGSSSFDMAPRPYNKYYALDLYCKENGLDANYTPVAAQTDALLAVAGGQADACVIDITMAKASTAEGTSYSDLGYKIELTTEEYGIGFRLDDKELLDKVNAAMDELAKDGTLEALAEKYELNLAF